MPYRPETELKRPDLKGEFVCGHCGKTFCHAASLNRHRLNFHGDDQQCQICLRQLAANETVRKHMTENHGITRVFTCGCCNWTFPDKKELHAHNNSMMRTGEPGDAKAIAVSNRAPGSLSQAEVKLGDVLQIKQGRTVRRKADNTPASPVFPFSLLATTATHNENEKKENTAGIFVNPVTQCSQMLSQLTCFAGFPSDMVTQFVLNNPSLVPFLQQIQTNSTKNNQDEYEDCGPSQIKEETPDEVEQTPITFGELKVKIEEDSVSTGNGPDSAVISGGEVTDSSPMPTDSSKEGSPVSIDFNQQVPVPGISINNRKRKSVDAIASILFQKKLGH